MRAHMCAATRVRAPSRAHQRVCAHTRMHTHTCARTHTPMSLCRHCPHQHINPHVHTDTHMCLHTQRNLRPCTDNAICTLTHMRTHTRVRAHTHTHTCAHTETYIPARAQPPSAHVRPQRGAVTREPRSLAISHPCPQCLPPLWPNAPIIYISRDLKLPEAAGRAVGVWLSVTGMATDARAIGRSKYRVPVTRSSSGGRGTARVHCLPLVSAAGSRAPETADICSPGRCGASPRTPGFRSQRKICGFTPAPEAAIHSPFCYI